MRQLALGRYPSDASLLYAAVLATCASRRSYAIGLTDFAHVANDIDEAPGSPGRGALGSQIVVVGALVWAAGRYSHEYVLPFAQWVRELGPWGPVGFIATYAIAEVVLIPGSVLTLIAGALFGFVAGSTYAFIGAMLGLAAAFLMGRYVVRPLVSRGLKDDAHYRQIDSAAVRGGARLVALLRLSPLLPFAVLNYALGITGIGLRSYLVGSLAILPGTLVYTYYGSAIANLAGLTQGVHRGRAFYLLMGVGVVATIAVTVVITRLARDRLQNEVPET